MRRFLRRAAPAHFARQCAATIDVTDDVRRAEKVVPHATSLASTAIDAATPIAVKTLWGVNEVFTADDAQLPELFRGVKAEVFDAVEFCTGAFFPFMGREGLATEALLDAGLTAVVQVHTCGYPVPPAFGTDHPKAASVTSGPGRLQPAWKAHVDSLRYHVETAMKQLDTARPTGGPICMFNCHGGKDSFTRGDAVRFFDGAAGVEKEFGVTIAHETHRQRLLHDPFVLRDIKDEIPAGVKLNADLSHWVIALERCPDEQLDAEFWPEVLDIVASRAHLIHARVGLPQQIQLQDPTAYLAAECQRFGLKHDDITDSHGALVTQEAMDVVSGHDYMDSVKAHVAWWRVIAQRMRDRGVPVRFEPEVGPFPYQTEMGPEADAHRAAIVASTGIALKRLLAPLPELSN